jgi:hypothetical protein
MNPDPAAPGLAPAAAAFLDRSALIDRIRPAVCAMNLTWGLAWLIGFGLMFARSGPDGRVLVSLPPWLPLAVLGILLVSAGVTTVVLGARVFGRGDVAAAAVQQARWYGTAWLVGFIGLIATVSAVTKGLPDDKAGLVWAISATGLTAALLMGGSGIWGDRVMFRLGIWITLVNIGGAIAGTGWQPLIIAVAGGGVQVIIGARGWLRYRAAGPAARAAGEPGMAAAGTAP